MIREGQGEPLVLLHGLTGTEEIWRTTLPYLTGGFDVIVPTALGHAGGAAAATRPAMIEHVVDEAERQLDELGLERPHFAGNSMGGWMALELARRGRAATVCALSPAGLWEPGSRAHVRSRKVIGAAARDARRSRRILPLLFRSKAARRWALRNTSLHGDRVEADALLALTDAMLECEVLGDLLTGSELVEAMDPVPCPITIAWSAVDRILPKEDLMPIAKERVPGARFEVLEDVGHVPMLDDPELTARTISASTRAESPARGATAA